MALSKKINVNGTTVQNACHHVKQVTTIKDTIVFGVAAAAGDLRIKL